MFHLVSPTLLSEPEFWQGARLAYCLNKIRFGGDLHLHVSFQNTRGVPAVYNELLAGAAADDDTVVFTHDDVTLDDWYLQPRLAEALARFDVVGVAGARRWTPRKCGWPFLETPGQWEAQEFLSGAVAHGEIGREQVSFYGATPAEVKCIDGMFIAAKVGTLRRAGVQFDPLFPHHFYDLDFCRSCEKAGLKLGTWPLAVSHASGGNFGTPEWKEAFGVYLRKWPE